MISRRSVCLVPFAAALSSTHALAAGWPNKVVRFITPYPPGGLADQVTRYAAEAIATSMGVTIIVENKPGAGAIIGTEYVARAEPDGYTFLVAPTATVAIAPWTRKLKYSLDDFEPVAKLASNFGLISTWKKAPFNNFKEFVAAAKKAPGKYTFASYGVGTATHLTAVRLHQLAGIDVLHVPYKGSSEAVIDLVGGRVDLMYEPSTLPRVQDGTLKGLATFPQPIPSLDVPTLAEQGYDLRGGSWFSMFAPKGTPVDILERMSAEVQKALTRPDAEQRLMISALYPDYQNRADFTVTVRKDSAYYKGIVDKLGIKLD